MKWKVLIAVIALPLVAFVALDAFVHIHHAIRVWQHSEKLELIVKESPTRESLLATLGSPWAEVNQAKAIELTNVYSRRALNAGKAKKYPKALIYMKGDMIYFIYLNDADKVVDRLVVQT